MGLGMNGITQDGGFGNSRSLHYEGVQFGYNFQSAGGLPITVYAGFDTLKYNAGIGGPFASFDSRSSTLPGYTRMRASKSSRHRMSACHSGSATPNCQGAHQFSLAARCFSVWLRRSSLTRCRRSARAMANRRSGGSAHLRRLQAALIRLRNRSTSPPSASDSAVSRAVEPRTSAAVLPLSLAAAVTPTICEDTSWVPAAAC